jgi:hypothetical protein
MAAKKSGWTRKPSVKFWLQQILRVILVLRLVMLMNLMNLKEQQQASAQEEESQAGTSGAGLSNGELPQGRNITVHPSVGPAKGVKKCEASHISRDSLPLSVLMLFFCTNCSLAGGTDEPVLPATRG